MDVAGRKSSHVSQATPIVGWDSTFLLPPDEDVSVVGLFAGIGGFELALSQAGFETGMLAEIDPVAQAVLKVRFPHAEIRSDVADVSDIPSDTTILTAGFPCQNLSMAGDKSGINGKKSNVVAKMFALIRRSRVPIVVIENVYFMLHLGSGAAMKWLVGQFEKLGYHWAYRVLDTMGFGLPHRRRRVYLVASRDVDPRCVLFADDGLHTPAPTPDISRPLGFYWTEGRSGVGFTVDGIPPLKVGSAIGIPSAPAVLFPDGEVLTPSVTACERLQGFTSGWTGANGAVVNGRQVWGRLIGNAVSVPVARWVGERIKTPGAVLDFEHRPLGVRQRWPDAAWNVSGQRIEVIADDKPIFTERPSIAAFREPTWTRLSDRALDGFIRRATEGRLRMPAGFLDALRSAPRKVPRSLGAP
jgi:DNA (cytosine-5)-methyltransferase 1